MKTIAIWSKVVKEGLFYWIQSNPNYDQIDFVLFSIGM